VSDASAVRPGAGPGQLNRPSTLRTYQLGEHRLTYLPDGFVQLDPAAWFPDSVAPDWRDLESYLDADGFLIGSVGSLLVEYGERALLIDTGFGPHKIPAARTIAPLGRLEGGQLPASLAASGRAPGSVGAVAFTHPHDDHVGWAVAGGADGRLFAGSRFFVSAAELPAAQALLPAGDRVVPAADGDEIFPGVTAWMTPGHTAGHVSYVITSNGARMIAFGDVLHSPVQVARPGWRVFSDFDTEIAERTRWQLLSELARPDTVGFGGHFADVVFGKVASGSSGRTWQPLP
jgi:glyoxylase-like metal-dependent hydrolase (beta-lactamase superfamily II)